MTLGIDMPASAQSADTVTGSRVGPDTVAFERLGWSSRAEECAPKAAALAALAALAAPDPVASVSYRSQGNLLVVAGGDGGRARRCAERLADSLHVTLLHAGPPAAAAFATWSGRIEQMSGYLGAFNATIAGLAHPGAAPRPGSTPARFDLVLDFSDPPLFAMRQPPQGYFAAPADEAALEATLAALREAVGEFEKPRFFAYRESLCAHARNEIEGCTACIEICSTAAIRADGDRVQVDPHLCMGCGACATVCPSGAMTYQYPRVTDRGAQMKRLLAAYREAGGEDACIVFHNGGDARALLAAAAAAGQGLPARALPLECWHVAAVGIDLLLPALAYGASQVVVLSAGSEDADYLAALRAQMDIATAIASGLGLAGPRFALVEAADPEALARGFAALDPAPPAPPAAAFALSADKRTSVEFAVEHLAALSAEPVARIALPEGAPYGEVRVDRAKCTMCMACVGACPESALMDGVDQPLLRFLERNCVQCGLCESTCPEAAISLAPRLLLGAPAREVRLLNETEPFHCVTCGKAFGTRLMVEAMVGRLAAHSMFTSTGAARRLQMCGDCRVVDMMSAKGEVSVLGLGSDE